MERLKFLGTKTATEIDSSTPQRFVCVKYLHRVRAEKLCLRGPLNSLIAGIDIDSPPSAAFREHRRPPAETCSPGGASLRGGSAAPSRRDRQLASAPWRCRGRPRQGGAGQPHPSPYVRSAAPDGHCGRSRSRSHRWSRTSVSATSTKLPARSGYERHRQGAQPARRPRRWRPPQPEHRRRSVLSPLIAAWPYPRGRTRETRDHDRPSTALAARLLRVRSRRSRTRPGPTSARPRRPHPLRPEPPYLSATTTGCATSRTSSPPRLGPTARCASASTWTVVVAGPAPASDTVFLYGVP
ncbi:hypothetical protein OV450_7347 [Actinobacteria bacterium OV450]|nr:hypothetical protein OV450_7347 [Actinobacteria bacterium OV450]